MKKFINRGKLLLMDKELSYPFPIVAKVRFYELDKLKSIEVPVHSNQDLHRFIYDYINPFKHLDSWRVNGDNYHSTFFYQKKGYETAVSGSFLVSHTMKNGLVIGSPADIKTNSILATS